MNRGNPQLSVVIPIYNSEKYLAECIESIIAQPYRNLEIVLVNDGSLDTSGEICKKYVECYSNIIVVNKENEGPLAARLSGVEIANGDYITFVDSDDRILDGMYLRMMAAAEKGNVDVIVCGICRFWNNGKIIENFPCIPEGLYEANSIEEKIIPVMVWNPRRNNGDLDPSLCSKVIKKDLVLKYLQKASNVKIHLGEDIIVTYPLMLEAQSLYVVNECFYYHRQRQADEIAPYIKDSCFFEKLYMLYQYLKNIFAASNFCKVLLYQLDYLYMHYSQLRRQYYLKLEEVPVSLFPYTEIGTGANIILYGAGKVGQDYKQQNDRYHFCRIVLWVDKNYGKFSAEMQVAEPARIQESAYDYVVLAVQAPELAEEIRAELCRMGIDAKKIIWMSSECQKLFERG